MPFGWRLIRIDGASMEPVLRHGDYAVARDVVSKRMPAPEDVVLVDHPGLGRIVKAVADRLHNGRFRLRGLSAATTPADDIGPVDADRVVAHVVWRIGAEGRVERVSRRRGRRPSAPASAGT